MEKDNLNNNSKPKYTPVKKAKTVNSSSSFGKSVVFPFVSGILGATLVVGVCFGVPNIKNKLITTLPSTSGTPVVSSSTVNNVVNTSDYSGTAINVANKVLPSIVGIKVEYEVNSIFYRQASTATATGSGIIISDDGYILTNNHIVDTSSSSSSSNGYSSYYSVSESNKVTVTLYVILQNMKLQLLVQILKLT